MDQKDFKPFAAMLDATCAMLSRGSYTPNAPSTAIFFNALRAHSFEVVSGAFTAHCQDPQRGRFPPVPADILAQIERASDDDGRPGPEEAWAIALQAADEVRTVVWTPEIAEAWGVARIVHRGGDEVGARMAFREAYSRLVVDARKRREPATWSPTLGSDPRMRDEALRVAIDAGKLPLTALPAPAAQTVGLLELVRRRGVPEHIRAKAAALRLAETPAQAAARGARRRDADLKVAHAQRMACYLTKRGAA